MMDEIERALTECASLLDALADAMPPSDLAEQAAVVSERAGAAVAAYKAKREASDKAHASLAFVQARNAEMGNPLKV